MPAGDGGVQRDLVYWIEAGDARTPAYQVRVVPAPVILVESIEYEYPAYTKLPKRIIERQGDLRAVEGTRITVRARANQPIAAAVLEFDPPPAAAESAVTASSRGSPQRALASSAHWVEMEFNGQEARCSFVCELDQQRLEPKYRSYQLRFATAGGQRNPQPVLHRIDVLRDLPPEIEILTPAQDRVEVPEDGWQKIEIRAIDPDYGLAAIRLRASAGARQVLQRDLLQDAAGRQGQEIATFNFAPREAGLRAGSEAKCWALAEDNRAAPGSNSPEPNVTKSREITFLVTRPAAAQEPDERGGQKKEPAPAAAGGGSPSRMAKAGSKPRSRRTGIRSHLRPVKNPGIWQSGAGKQCQTARWQRRRRLQRFAAIRRFQPGSAIGRQRWQAGFVVQSRRQTRLPAEACPAVATRLAAAAAAAKAATVPRPVKRATAVRKAAAPVEQTPARAPKAEPVSRPNRFTKAKPSSV